MAITAVGTLFKGGGSGVTTLAVTPVATDNILVFSTYVIGSPSITTVSGGGVTTWIHLLGPFSATANTVAKMDLWFGVVTGTGAQTITATPSSSVSGLTVRLDAQEFAGGGAGTLWALDGTQTGTKNNASSSSITFPTLTAAGSGELYVGMGLASATTTVTAGYVSQLNLGGSAFIYNTSVSGAQTPVVTGMTAIGSSCVGAILTATPPGAATNRGLLALFM